MNILTEFVHQTTKHSEKKALIEAVDRRDPLRYRFLTYRELENRVVACAQKLASMGVRKGQRYILFVPMSIELYILLMALFARGATAVFLDSWSHRKRLERAIELVKPHGLIGVAARQLLRLISPKVRHLAVTIPASRLLKRERNTPPPPLEELMVRCHPDDDALVTLTTGSTGPPKAARRTHQFLLQQHRVLSSHLALTPEDVDYSTLPVFVLHNLAQGAASVLPCVNPRRPHIINPRRVATQMALHNCTSCIGSPWFYQRLLESPKEIRQQIPLQKIFLGGAPVMPNLVKKLMQQWPEAESQVLYGSTEVEPISKVPFEQYLNCFSADALPAGKPISQLEQRIFDVQALRELKKDKQRLVNGILTINSPDEISLEAGHTGEVAVAGAHVLEDYLGDREAIGKHKLRTLSPQPRLWHLTGDMGYLDPKGNLFLRGRKSHRINIKTGETIYPLCYELKVRGFEEIAMAALVMLHGQLILVCELKKPALLRRNTTRLNTLVQAIKQALPEVKHIIWQKIPMDPRHHSRVDYETLKRILRH